MAAPRRGSRAESGMIHDVDFTLPFQKALEALEKRFPDNCFSDTVPAKNVQIVLASLKGLVFQLFEETFWRLCQDDVETEAGQKKWRNHKDVLTKVCTGKYEGRVLPSYVLEGIRDMQHPKLRSLLAHIIIVGHNHRFARTKNIPATIPLDDPCNRLSTWSGDPEPPETFQTFTYGIAPEPGQPAPPVGEEQAHEELAPPPPPPPPAQPQVQQEEQVEDDRQGNRRRRRALSNQDKIILKFPRQVVEAAIRKGPQRK